MYVVPSWVPLNGQLCVELFFIVSGFYMGLILTEKYNKKSDYGLFISNRLLKLYPIYIAVCILTLAAFFFLEAWGANIYLFNTWTTYFSMLTAPDLALLAFSNLFFLGHTEMAFFSLGNQGQITLLLNSYPTMVAMSNFFLVPQSWSLDFELLFYLMAPFLNRFKTRDLTMIAMCSMASKVYFLTNGYDPNLFGYWFFPSEFFLFILGLLSYRLYKMYFEKTRPTMVVYLIPPLFLLGLISYNGWPDIMGSKLFLLYLLTAIILPVLFMLTRDNPVDRLIGELSYPIYITHMLVIWVVMFLIQKGILSIGYAVPFTILVAMGLSYLLYKYLQGPVEAYRQNRVKKSRNDITGVGSPVNSNTFAGDMKVLWTRIIALLKI